MRLWAVLGGLGLLLLGGPAAAEFRGWGPRLGISDDPDQVHLGFHVDLGPLHRRVRLQPNFELGLGSDRTLAVLNFEAAYRFRARWDAWSPYAGGGAGVEFEDRHDAPHGDGSDTEIGFSLLGGIERGLAGGDRFFVEVKLGFGLAPDVKATLGWTFR